MRFANAYKIADDWAALYRQPRPDPRMLEAFGMELLALALRGHSEGELAAWRLAHEAGGAFLSSTQRKVPAMAAAGAEAYRISVEQTMAKLGFPVSSVNAPTGRRK